MLFRISWVIRWTWCRIKVFGQYVRCLYWPEIYKHFVSKERYEKLKQINIRRLKERNRELDVKIKLGEKELEKYKKMGLR